MAAIDVRSADIVLVHDGSDRGAAGAPARDLSANDIGRLAYRRALAAVSDQVGRPIDPSDLELGVITRPDPRQPDEAIVAEILEELLASGRYAPAAPIEPPSAPTESASTPASGRKKTPEAPDAPAGEKTPDAPDDQSGADQVAPINPDPQADAAAQPEA